MAEQVAPNLTPEEQASVDRSRVAFARGGPGFTKHHAEKMQGEADVNNATYLRQQAKQKLIRQANKDQPHPPKR